MSWLFNESMYTNLSVWMVLLPAILSLLTIRVSSQSACMLALFMLGLLTEIFTKIQGSTNNLTLTAFILYCFSEATIFYCIVKNPVKDFKPIVVLKTALFFSLPLFLICYLAINQTVRAIGVYNMAYEVAVSYLAGRQILRTIEVDTNATRSSSFWLLLGIFVYCFTTFFLMGIIELSATRELWDPFHNTINMVTHGIFALSFWKRYRGYAIARMS